MASRKPTVETDPTLPFETFWAWLLRHPNCILRAGTSDSIIFDDDDLHWHFAAEGQALFVQVIRGKRLIGEIILDTDRIAYVEAFGEQENGEFGFELIGESETDRNVAYFFVMSHGYEDEEIAGPGLAVH